MIRSLLFLLTLWSGTFSAGQLLPQAAVYDQDGCHGANRSPDLRWRSGPKGTKSFAIVMDDADAPGGFYHWVLYDIPASVHHLAAGTRAGVTGTSSWGQAAYGGPCPPPGQRHRYVFYLYALNAATLARPGVKLDGPALLQKMIPHILASAKLTGSYER